MINVFKKSKKPAGLSAPELLKNIGDYFSKGTNAEQPPKVEKQERKTVRVHDTKQLG